MNLENELRALVSMTSSSPDVKKILIKHSEYHGTEFKSIDELDLEKHLKIRAQKSHMYNKLRDI